jgi:hypothetical protein
MVWLIVLGEIPRQIEIRQELADTAAKNQPKGWMRLWGTFLMQAR